LKRQKYKKYGDIPALTDTSEKATDTKKVRILLYSKTISVIFEKKDHEKSIPFSIGANRPGLYHFPARLQKTVTFPS